jgi:hypothetical protein
LQLPVRALTYAANGAYTLSAADGERLLAVWAAPGKSSSSKKKSAVAAASLAIDQPIVGISTVGEVRSGQGKAVASLLQCKQLIPSLALATG